MESRCRCGLHWPVDLDRDHFCGFCGRNLRDLQVIVERFTLHAAGQYGELVLRINNQGQNTIHITGLCWAERDAGLDVKVGVGLDQTVELRPGASQRVSQDVNIPLPLQGRPRLRLEIVTNPPASYPLCVSLTLMQPGAPAYKLSVLDIHGNPVRELPLFALPPKAKLPDSVLFDQMQREFTEIGARRDHLAKTLNLTQHYSADDLWTYANRLQKTRWFSRFDLGYRAAVRVYGKVDMCRRRQPPDRMAEDLRMMADLMYLLHKFQKDYPHYPITDDLALRPGFNLTQILDAGSAYVEAHGCARLQLSSTEPINLDAGDSARIVSQATSFSLDPSVPARRTIPAGQIVAFNAEIPLAVFTSERSPLKVAVELCLVRAKISIRSQEFILVNSDSQG